MNISIYIYKEGGELYDKGLCICKKQRKKKANATVYIYIYKIR
jgi:hypothetical protein